MDINFYYIDSNYIEYLKATEIEKRGFTCVPNTNYSSRQKFLFGAVFEYKDINYFVPVSSKIKFDDNSMVMKSGKNKNLKLGTLRFSYMIPVPNKCLIPLVINDIPEETRKRKVRYELSFCRKNIDKIRKQANKTYDAVTKSTKKKIINNSCDFKLLEQAYIDYCAINNISLSNDTNTDLRYMQVTSEELKILKEQNFEFVNGKELVFSQEKGYILKLSADKAKQVQNTLDNPNINLSVK